MIKRTWMRRALTWSGLGLVGLVAVAGIALASYGRYATHRDSTWATLVDSHRHSAIVDGVTLHYIDLGGGEPVVLVHGFGDSTYTWHANASALVDAGFRVILVDQPGLGRSETPARSHVYSMENQARAVLKVVDHLGIDRFRLVGHSMGGGIALYLGLRYPARVAAIAAVDPTSFRAPCSFGRPGVELVARMLGARHVVALSLRDAYAHKDKVPPVVVDEYARPLEGPGRLSVLTSLCRQYWSPEFERMAEEYRTLEPPLLMVWGSRDPWVPPSFGTRMHALVPGSQLEMIPDAGHNPHQEAPGAVNPLLVGFLLSHPGSAAAAQR